MKDCTLQNESERISLEHMTTLATQYRDSNHYQFLNNFHILSPTIPTSDEEHLVLRGVNITNKNCYYKKPAYPAGEWEKQFKTIMSDEIKFNIRSKERPR